MLAGMALASVAAVIVPGVSPFELGVACEGFGVDRRTDGVPGCEFHVVAVDDGPVRTSAGFSINTPYGLDVAEHADLVIVTATVGPTAWPDELLTLLRSTVERGARVMSICNGAFALGAAGLDLCLHLIRGEHGERVANIVARRMVMPPFRDGGQAQFVGPVVHAREAETLAPLLDAIAAELDVEHTVDSMAARAAMSARTFARRFRDETGGTPHAWLTNQRVLHAREMLERGDDSIETVARRSGFGTAAMLRHHFTRVVGTSPAAYRRTFRG